jgi:pyruvate/2-oxoglutarate dehydrogenase complex dihydrolipoamide acyltransferase (E2) component
MHSALSAAAREFVPVSSVADSTTSQSNIDASQYLEHDEATISAAVPQRPSTMQQAQWWRQRHAAPGGVVEEKDDAAAAADADDQRASWAALQATSGWRHLDEDAVASLLSGFFPSQSQAMLRRLYNACNGSIPEMLIILTDIEREQDEAAAAEQAAAQAAAAAAFPSLAESATAGSTGAPRRRGAAAAGGAAAAVGSSWAAVAATLPSTSVLQQQEQEQQQQQHRMGQRLQQMHAADRAALAAARAGGVVPWVQTGASVAAQYADARSEARDYARLRNKCFQQARRCSSAVPHIHSSPPAQLSSMQRSSLGCAMRYYADVAACPPHTFPLLHTVLTWQSPPPSVCRPQWRTWLATRRWHAHCHRRGARQEQPCALRTLVRAQVYMPHAMLPLV